MKFSCFHHFFEDQIRSSSGASAIAVESDDYQIDYGELDRRANRLAQYLIKIGVARERLVGVSVRRSIDMFVTLLAIAKAGGAYVPIDPSEQTARRADVIASSGLEVLVSDSGAPRDRNMPNTITLVDLLNDSAEISAAPDNNPNVPVTGQNLAYLIFTSGSTGQPKGIAMEHRSLAKLIEWHGSVRPESRAMRTLQFCSIGFDFSFHEIFSTLCHGGTLIIPNDEERLDPSALARFIRAKRIEKMFLPVSVLLQWAAAVNEASFPDRLREVITTGEQLRITPPLRSIFAKTGAQLHNHYGATEFQDAATFTLSGDPETWPTIIPAGNPLAIVHSEAE